MFFFEKKNQKTFILEDRCCPTAQVK